MIVDPDFFDHWKTLLLIEQLDDPCAPIYVLRLWAHCQKSRKHTFDNLPPQALKALCRYSGHPNKLDSCLTASGFVRRDGSSVTLVGWDTYNAALISKWDNGKRGGRPRRKPDRNRTVTENNRNTVDKTREESINTFQETTTTQIDKPLHPSGEVLGEPPKPSKKESPKKPKEPYPPVFEEWYFTYPKHVGKDKALTAWKKAGGRVVVERKCSKVEAAAYLLERAKAYAKSDEGRNEDRSLIPHPASWLNAGRYNDDEREWQRAEPKVGRTPLLDRAETGTEKIARLARERGEA